MRNLPSAISVGILLIAAGTLAAQDAKTAEQGSSREVRKLLNAMEESFNSGNAQALAACWTARGDFTATSGERIEGRKNIENAFRTYLSAHKAGKLKLRITSFRIADDDLVLVEAAAVVKTGAAGDAGEHSLLNLVLVKRDGGWLIESARETPKDAHSPARHLDSLEWLVGDWTDQVSPQEGLSVRSSCDWTANRSFLIRKFKIEGRDGFSRRGTEVIGWDPRQRRIRSWLFDSEGGFGENVWIQDGKRWLIGHTGTRPDGSETSATNIITVVDADTLTLQTTKRTVNGERQPDVPKVTIKRQRAGKGQDGDKAPTGRE